MDQKSIAKWLSDSLKKSGKTQTELAEAIGLTQTMVSNIKNLRREMSAVEVFKAAEFLGVPLPNEKNILEVRHYIGAGAQVIPIDDGGEPIYEVEVDFPLPHGAIGAIVRGDSQYPIFEDGDLVAYGGDLLTPEQAIGETCIVQLADGRMLIKKVRRGSQPGLYTLTSTNAPDIEDVAVESARAFIMRISRRYWRKS